MTLFWILSVAMALIALAIIAPPLLRNYAGQADEPGRRTDQNIAIARERLAELEEEHAAGVLALADFEQAKRELELNLAGDLVEEQTKVSTGGNRALLVVLAIIFPVATVGIYQNMGAPEHLSVVGPGGGIGGNPHAQQGETPSVEELTARLEQRLQEEPNNPDGWFMLGRTKMSMGQYEQAAEAFQKTLDLVGEHPSILVALADSVAMSQSGRISGRPAELVQRALAVSPDDVTALWLAGQAAEEQGELEAALGYWRRAEVQLHDQPGSLAEIRSMIARVEGESGIQSQPLETEGPSVALDISLSPELAARVEPTDTVFIFARAVEGPPMPVAAAKLQASDLPARVTLNDEMAMMPQMKLSLFEQVKVGARISRSGQPTPASGDLQSDTHSVNVGGEVALKVLIDREVP